MPAYVIADVEVTNQQGYDAYRARTLATVEMFGGRFIGAAAVPPKSRKATGSRTA